MRATGAPRVIIGGSGYVGTYCAMRLERLLAPGQAELLLISPRNYMLYQPLLPEVASGTLEPRHATVPLRKVLRRTRVVRGHLTDVDADVDADGRTVSYRNLAGEEHALGYDDLVLGLGAESATPPIPGLAEHAVGFRTVTEALHLRHRVLEGLEAAEATNDPAERARQLTTVVVGGGYTGVEAIAELEDLARNASREYPRITAEEQRWVLVEMTDRLLPTVEDALAEHALHELRARGIEVRLETMVERIDPRSVTLSDGEEVPTNAVAWVAGVQPNPLPARAGLPTDEQGRVQVEDTLQVKGTPGVWAAGDTAAVPRPDGGFYPPTAQHAQRQGKHLADNVAAALTHRPLAPFRYDSPGELISLGDRKGVGVLYGRKLRGFLPWMLRRAYYAGQIPSLDRKVRLLLEWTVGAVFRRDPISLPGLEEPEGPLRDAAGGGG